MPPSEEDEDEESSAAHGDEEDLSRREFVILLARDVAIAVIVVGTILGAIFAYAQVWPPMVVVESGSMQHSDTRSYLNVVDTGDLVFLRSVGSHTNVVTYVEGRRSGYETYSNYGDVIIFHQPGTPPGTTPIIHRPIVYVEAPSSTSFGGVDAPSLASWPDTWSATHPDGSSAGGDPRGLGSITIRVRTWFGGVEGTADITYPGLGSITTSGFLTKGDHNRDRDWWGRPVADTEIVGKAWGELPWIGLIKLTAWPTTGCCRSGWGSTGPSGAPMNSWDSLTTSLVLIPLGIFLADHGFAFAENLWKAYRTRRKAVVSDDADEASAAEDPPTESDGPR